MNTQVLLCDLKWIGWPTDWYCRLKVYYTGLVHVKSTTLTVYVILIWKFGGANCVILNQNLNGLWTRWQTTDIVLHSTILDLLDCYYIIHLFKKLIYKTLKVSLIEHFSTPILKKKKKNSWWFHFLCKQFLGI